MPHCAKEIEAPNVVAVTVTYHPDLEVLEKQLHLLGGQVKSIVVVDNGSSLGTMALNKINACGAEVVELGENKGIAAAQNVGIAWAKESGADFVVLFDQDSLPVENMVAQLLEAHDAMAVLGYKVAAIGPRYLDPRRHHQPPFIRIEGLKLVRCLEGEIGDVVRVDYLISSGCLIPIRTLQAVGMMNEEMFIDYVDIEWGLRAKQCGYQAFGTFGACMQHRLGDNPISLFGRSFPLHSPLRHYYLARNAVWLYRQPWVPANWKWVDGYRMIIRFVFYSLFTKRRWQHCKMMLLGYRDGWRRKMGVFGQVR